MKAIRVLAILVLVYIALGLVADGAVSYFQPQTEGTVVLRTFDANANANANAGMGTGAQDAVLTLFAGEGQLWLVSGRWFRGWYHRVQANPDVELVREGRAEPFRAVPVDTPEAVDRVTRLMGKGAGAGYWVGRTLLLWAPIQPVRLDPRPASPGA